MGDHITKTSSAAFYYLYNIVKVAFIRVKINIIVISLGTSSYLTSIVITKLTFAVFAQTEYIIRCYFSLCFISFVAFIPFICISYSHVVKACLFVSNNVWWQMNVNMMYWTKKRYVWIPIYATKV